MPTTDPNTNFDAYADDYISGVVDTLEEYARQIKAGDYEDEPYTEDGGSIYEYGLDLVVAVGRPVTWLLGCGGPTTYVEWDAAFPMRGTITHAWGGKSKTVAVQWDVSETLFDYLATPVIDSMEY